MPTISPDQWHFLSPYLDEALAMTDEERTTWLSSLRIQSPGLADQVQMLLEDHRALSEKGFLESDVVGLSGRSGLAGQTLGAYTLVSQIGHGGMGTVWLAERNDERFERRVAVKLLNVALMGKTGEERFKREGRILGRLRHPHIAELIDAGVTQTGQPYLILEHIEGNPIDCYCDRHELNVEARVRLFLDVLGAVAEAHANLIVHRDLKPSNVLVRNDGQAKLLDFGIAKLLEVEGQTGKSPLTVEGGPAMTPEYAAPEQLKGEAVTTATDVYALGVLLYILLTGQHPAGTGPRTPAALVKAILDTEPARPSDIVAATETNQEIRAANASRRAVTPDKLGRLLRGDLDTIVAKALKKASTERYSSVSALADDLGRYLRNEPIRARPDTSGYRAAKFIRRHRGSLMVALLATVTVIGASIVTWLLSRGSEPLPQFKQRRLTANGQDSPVLSAAISPDGKYLGYADQRGLHLQIVETGGTVDVPLPPGIQPGKAFWGFDTWYPDSTRFIASVAVPGKPVIVWSVPIRAGEPEKLAEVEDMVDGGRVSPDGLHIAYTRLRSTVSAREIWLMGSHGESPHKVLTAEDRSAFENIAWSPTGNRIAYSVAHEQGSQMEVSIQSCDLRGGNKTTILQDNALFDFTWLPSGRLIYSRSAKRGTPEADNLWELRVDDKSGTPQGTPRRLTDWSGFSVSGFSAAVDGKRLAFLRSTHNASVFVGDLVNDGSRLVNPHRLTADDNINILLAWTPDSREVLFSSKRAANRLIYTQALDQGSAARLIASAVGMEFLLARFSPDGAWVILEGRPSGSSNMALYRVGITGGVPQLLFRSEEFVQYWCTNKAANLCVFGESPAGKNELVVTSFDPVRGKGKEVTRIPLEPGSSAVLGHNYTWQLSPDGSRIAIAKRHSDRISLVPLDGSRKKAITIKGHSDVEDLSWANDSRSMFVSSLEPGGATLLHVDFEGNAVPLWQQPQTTWTWGFTSPDGRHLAMLGESSEANVWMIGNF